MSDDLTNTFGAPARALAGLLPSRTARERPPVKPATQQRPEPDPVPAQPTAQSAPDADVATAPSAPAAPAAAAPNDTQAPQVPQVPPADTTSAPVPRRRSNTPRRTASPPARSAEPTPDASYQVSVYVLPAIKAAAAQRRSQEKLTNAEVAFDAIDAVQHRLAGLIRDRRTKPRAENSLFPPRITRHARPSTDSAASNGRRVLWAMRATAPELEVLDRLVANTGAESRSELVSVALEAALLPRR